MRKNRLYLSTLLFGSLAFVLFALLAFLTVKNATRAKAMLLQNALTQGYWIARSLEIVHSMVQHDHAQALREMLREIEQYPNIRFLRVLDTSQRVLIASETMLEGQPWPQALGTPAETGRVVTSDGGVLELVFPAFFARDLSRRRAQHSQAENTLDNAKWIILGLDVSTAQDHYRETVVQSVFVSLAIVILGLAAFLFFGIIQRYQLASASLEQLERIKQALARFVPDTVQRLIEADPLQPMLDKVERQATVLFLDIDHYTELSQCTSPTALNHLIETYFAAFLDIILSHSGDINETAGDGVMAIFTGKTPRAHALNAVKAALAIRAKAQTLNRNRELQDPEILVNIGINTGPVLLGATMIKGAVGQRFTYTASGMVTNIAARLCDLSTAGDIHLSETTARLVQDQYPLLGPLETHLKHIHRPLPVYKLA